MSYLSVRIEGNILTDDILQNIAKGEAQYQSDKDFGTSKSVRDEILTAWADLKRQYETYKSRKTHIGEDDSGMQVTRTFWSVPLLQLLGYTPTYRREAELINDRNYQINYPDEKLDGFPILIVGFRQELDKKPVTGLRISPHALMQDYLNVKDGHIYGIVTNGDELRLLRDSSLMTRLSHVSFDLIRMMEEDLFSDFQLMYRLLHASRIPQDKRSTDSILEKYHEESLASGSRIREKLSEAVEQCLLKLGTGFLGDLQNKALRDWTMTQQDAPTEYYDWLLKLIYRILFLLVIEERDLIYPKEYKKNDALREKRRIYYQYYSLQRLRKLADKRRYASERNADLWEQVLATFLIFDAGDHGKALEIKPLAGDLFNSSAIGKLNDCRLNNKILLECIRLLNHFENKRGQLIRVNYASLDVEEFGSVYEGLLEYSPVIDAGRWAFSFKEGSGRSISGSHYTPDELVQPLIKHSLDHLIADRTVSLHSNEEKKGEAIQKILSLSVCDVACGSGHILLAAARRIGLEVARLRTGEQQPNLVSARLGTRDAIRHCIYGVDKNPLAVTLCKVALWLEAHAPSEPLNFLDHKIKCGDSIVGLAHFEELQDGINDEAFKKQQNDDPAVLKNLRKENKDGKAGYERIVQSGHQILNKFRINPNEYERVLTMPETTPKEIDAKKAAYQSFLGGSGYLRLRMFADFIIAPFFLSKTKDNEKLVPTNIDFYQIVSGHKSFQNTKMAMATDLSYQRSFFHWFLEFPEIFAIGGFDCILGNPPFLGGQKISGTYGKNYAEYIKEYFKPIGSVDLVTYFFRRIFTLLKDGGFQSLISTNTIAQGDAREGGLEVIIQQGGTINHAVRSMRWPGLAAVEVALVTIAKRSWKAKRFLNFKESDSITTYLDDEESLGNPFTLKQNENKSFMGSIPLGTGFILDELEAMKLLHQREKNKNAIYKYLNGADLNNDAQSTASRYIICFWTWDKDICELEYPELWKIIEERVKPDRHRDGNTMGRDKYWQYYRPVEKMYATISKLDQVICIARTSKTGAFTFVSTNQILNANLTVIASSSLGQFAVLQSNVHIVWAWKYCTRLKTDMIYQPTDVYETYPFPSAKLIDDQLEATGQKYFYQRSELMLRANIGLTKLYNFFNCLDLKSSSTIDLGKKSTAEIKKIFSKESWNLYKHLRDNEGAISFQDAVEQIIALRRLHKEMDQTVLASYGWYIDTERWGPAIQLQHDFYEVDYLPENDCMRYTIHPEARKEVLRRLLLLNHEIHEAEERNITWEQLNEEKIIALLQKKVEKWLPHTNRLFDGSLKALCAGEDLLPSLHTATVQSYNAFVVQYGSAIEYELLHKIFVPFNDQFKQQHPHEKEKKTYLDGQIAADPKEPKRIAKFCGMLLKDDTKYTMGDMHFILSLVHNPNGNTLSACTLLQDLRTFVLSVYTESILNRDFLERINNFIKTFRNEAAHTGIISREEAMMCRDEVRGILGILVDGELSIEKAMGKTVHFTNEVYEEELENPGLFEMVSPDGNTTHQENDDYEEMEDNDIVSSVDREYWIKKRSEESIQLADRLIELLNEDNHNYTLVYLKSHIKLTRDRDILPFVRLRLWKKFIAFILEAPQSPEIDTIISTNDLEDIGYNKITGRYRVRVRNNDLENKREALRELFQAIQRSHL